MSQQSLIHGWHSAQMNGMNSVMSGRLGLCQWHVPKFGRYEDSAQIPSQPRHFSGYAVDGATEESARPVCGLLVEKDSKRTMRQVYARRLCYSCSNADRDRFMSTPPKYLR